MAAGYSDYYKPMERLPLTKERRKGALIALDFETTNIPKGRADTMRVKPLYATAWGERGLLLSKRLNGYGDLAACLASDLFTDERVNCRYVTWNGNRFDFNLIFDAIKDHLFDRYKVELFRASQAGIRGGLVISLADEKKRWYLWDGIAMLGMAKRSLADFTAKFSPELQKRKRPHSFDDKPFDPKDPEDIAYAEQDVESLYNALLKAESIIRDITGRGLQMTIGNAGIKYFQTQIPEDTQIWPLPNAWRHKLNESGKRGGFVFTERQYKGPVWQWDVNQAYAAAMREVDLPCGRHARTRKFIRRSPGIYDVTIAHDRTQRFPFYVRVWDEKNNRGDGALETYGDSVRCVITSDEYRYLDERGWNIQIHDGLVWSGSFRMAQMVDTLERYRREAIESDNAPLTEMVKAIGNNSYGKTGEVVPNYKHVMQKEKPTEDAMALDPLDPALIGYWIVPEKRGNGLGTGRRFHRPQIAAFITASVRLKIYRHMEMDPEAFLKADTDSVTYSRPVDGIACDPVEYGKMKTEYAGANAIILGKKVYAVEDKPGKWKFVCKGLNTRTLTVQDFERWYEYGEPPKQLQIQTLGPHRGFGEDSPQYKAIERHGTVFEDTKSVQWRRIARLKRELEAGQTLEFDTRLQDVLFGWVREVRKEKRYGMATWYDYDAEMFIRKGAFDNAERAAYGFTMADVQACRMELKQIGYHLDREAVDALLIQASHLYDERKRA